MNLSPKKLNQMIGDDQIAPGHTCQIVKKARPYTWATQHSLHSTRTQRLNNTRHIIVLMYTTNNLFHPSQSKLVIENY